MADIFISYASEDRSRVLPIAKALENHGWTVFWDRAIPPGKSFDQVIQEAITASKCVVVLWSISSIISNWVKEEATIGNRRQILVPAKIDAIEPPLGFGLIQAADLTAWEAKINHAEFESFLSAISDIAGPPPPRENGQQNAEIPESSLEQRSKVQPKAREIPQEISQPTQPEPAEAIPSEPIPDATATPEPNSNEPRKMSNALKFGAAAGVVVLLIVGIWWWISLQQVKQVRQEMEGLDIQIVNLEKSVSNLDKPEQIGDFTSQRDTLSRQVEDLIEQANKVGLKSEPQELQNRLEQIQIQLADREKVFIEARQAMEKLDRQVLSLENSVAELIRPEQIEEFTWQRDTLSNHVEGFREQATKAGMGLQVEQLQDRLGQIQIQLANREKELAAARKSKLFVESVPENGIIKILNIGQDFQQGMEIEPGKYHLQVSSNGYEPEDRWIELAPGEEKRINFELKKRPPWVARLYVETVPEYARVRILNIKPKFLQGMALDPGRYHLEVAGEGYETKRRWIDLGDGEEKRINFELKKRPPWVARLHVETVPEYARVRILNIKPKFLQGMALDPGRYHLEVAAKGYDTEKLWINLEAGHKEPFRFELVKIKIPEPISPQKND